MSIALIIVGLIFFIIGVTRFYNRARISGIIVTFVGGVIFALGILEL